MTFHASGLPSTPFRISSRDWLVNKIIVGAGYFVREGRISFINDRVFDELVHEWFRSAPLEYEDNYALWSPVLQFVRTAENVGAIELVSKHGQFVTGWRGKRDYLLELDLAIAFTIDISADARQIEVMS